ncbi:MAG TPA: hypothetical protein VF137_12575 [Candidatus Dormibacteraeota bacterium]
MTGQLSPDGNWWYDGEQWVSAISPDRLWRWDGVRWVVNDAPARYAVAFRYAPTSDTRRVQVAVTAYVVAAVALGATVLPITFNHSAQLLEATSTTYPDQQFFQGFMNVVLGFTLAFTFAWAALQLVGTWKRWRWVYYVVMIFGVLSVFSLLTNSLALAGVAAYKYLPAWAAATNIVLTLAYIALTVWMFTLWRRYKTAWATRAEPV